MKRILILTTIASLVIFGCDPGTLDPVRPDDTEQSDNGEGNGNEGGQGENGGGGENEGSEGQEGGEGQQGQGNEGSGEGGGTQPLELITVFSENFDSGVSLNGLNASIRNDNYGSKGNNGTYEGATGAGYVRMTYLTSSKTYGYLVFENISTCGRTDFNLSLGAMQGKSEMSIEVIAAGASQTLDFNFKGTYNNWEKVSCSFSIPEGTASFTLKFTLLVPYPDYKYGANIDDILITSGGNSGQQGQGGSEGGSGESSGQGDPGRINKYVENPSPSTNSDYCSSTLYTHTVRTNKSVRNFSFCYDTRRHNPIWVAFPMHSIYAEGNGGRTSPDPWQKYPGLPTEKQSIIWNIEDSGYQYWSYTARQSQGFSWTKGHLCMSASRGGADSEMNIQTFYPVNIAPQIGSRAPRFAELWSKTENYHYHRGTQICSDTLYVVCGCYYGDPTWIEYDACNYGEHSQWSKQVEMPTNQYKILLRTRSGNSGKRVQDCSASELKAIGFWFDSIIPDSASAELKDYAVSIAEIERRTGLEFFPAVTSDIKSQCVPSDWGL